MIDRSDAVNLARNVLDAPLDPCLTHEGARILARAVLAMDAALSDAPLTQAEPDRDPCPGCRKGIVCRTPACGRLKLPSDHPLRTYKPEPHPQRQTPQDRLNGPEGLEWPS